MLCTEWTLVKDAGEHIYCQPLYCNSWKCEICHPRRADRLQAQAHAGAPNSFLTLTSNPRVGASPDERARLLSAAWKNLRRWIKRNYNLRAVPFLAVFEKTKRGEPHLHILMRAPFIKQADISLKMDEYADAPIVWITRVRSKKHAARYVAKYVGKDPALFEGTKRYWQSPDYQVTSREDDDELLDGNGEWRVERKHIRSFLAWWPDWMWSKCPRSEGYYVWSPGRAPP